MSRDAERPDWSSDEVFDGIVGVALLGTLAVCLGVLLLFSIAGFRVTARGAQIIAVLVVGIGYANDVDLPGCRPRCGALASLPWDRHRSSCWASPTSR